MSVWIDSPIAAERWEELGPQGKGGQGITKKARAKSSGKLACLKILSRQSDHERRARFFREATAYSTFQHDGIPRLVESNAHQHDDLQYRLYLVAEFIEGPTLAEWVSDRGPMSLEEAIALLFRLTDVVGHLHDERWVHRDIKPDNIILRDGHPSDAVLLDFGLSYKDDVISGLETEHGQEIGNRFLRLPELSVDSLLKQDARSDLAFLGGILFFVLTGSLPATLMDAEGRMPHQRAQAMALLSETAGGATGELLALFDSVFAQKLNERLASASMLKDSLSRIVQASQGQQTDVTDDDLTAIKAAVDNRANRALLKVQSLYDVAFAAVTEVQRGILKDLHPTYRSHETGHVNLSEGASYEIGYSHFANVDARFAPEFLVKVVGEELVLFVDGAPLHRTSVDDPQFDDRFKQDVRRILLKGVRELVESRGEFGAASQFFRSKPHDNLPEALRAAAIKDAPVFAIIYDDTAAERSRISYALGNFMRFKTTKELVDAHFVVALLPATQPEARRLVPDDDPLETARWVVIEPSGNVFRSEGVYANPEEGLRRVREVVEKWRESRGS